jgi:hypothetical protein
MNTSCECGNEKTPLSICCKRCAFLDGMRCFQGYVISTLRTAGAATTFRSLANETKSDERQLWRALKTMQANGRCELRSIETDVGRHEKLIVLRAA